MQANTVCPPLGERTMKMKPWISVWGLFFLCLSGLSCSTLKQYDAPSPVECVCKILRKAESGDADYQLRIARCYLTGETVDKDFVQACKWFYVAAQHENGLITNATEAELSALESKMTADQIAEARKLANDFNRRKRERRE